MDTPIEREERFRALYSDAYPAVLRFARRRASSTQADDVTADTFLVAWRRLDDVPRLPDDARVWLFGIARRCLLNAQRGQGRHGSLVVRLASAAPPLETDRGLEADAVMQRLDVARAWSQLGTMHQEALALNVFEDLTSPQAARVLGISAAAYRVRLLRARRALQRLLAVDDDLAASPTPASLRMETQP